MQDDTHTRAVPPILDNKRQRAASVFRPAALLREARRQKGLAAADVPPVCLLDPDGDIVRRLRRKAGAALRRLALLSHALDTFGSRTRRVVSSAARSGRRLRY